MYSEYYITSNFNTQHTNMVYSTTNSSVHTEFYFQPYPNGSPCTLVLIYILLRKHTYNIEHIHRSFTMNKDVSQYLKQPNLEKI